MFRENFQLLVCAILCSLNVSSSDDFRIIPSETKILRVGEDTKLECFLKEPNFNDSPIQIHWERPLGTIISNGPVLILRNVQLVDSGNYTCKALQAIKSKLVSQEVVEQIIINPEKYISKPEIIIPELNNTEIITLTETQFLFISCKVKNWNREKYRVQWVKESTRQYVSLSDILFIKSVVKEKDDGLYCCEILHNDDQSRIFKQYVKIEIIKPSIQTIIEPTENLNINGWIHRKCLPFNVSINTSMEKFSFRWLYENGTVVSRNSILQIPINDYSVLGSYECQYFAEYAQTIYSSKIIVSRIQTEHMQKKKYSISIISYPDKFRLNDRLTIRCQLSPVLKNVKYEWFRDGKLYHTGQTLIFSKFKKQDLNQYECYASGTDENSVQISLMAVSDQRIHNFDNNKIELTDKPGPNLLFQINEVRELHCEIDADSDASGNQVEWFFNNEKLTDSLLNSYRLTRFNKRLVSILVFLNTQMDNEGHYECQSGYIKREANIFVEIEQGFLILNPPEIKVYEGDPVEFHCKIDEFHDFDNRNLTWKFYNNDESINMSFPNDRWKLEISDIADHTSFISVSKAEQSDNGFVECSSSNGLVVRGSLVVQKITEKFNITVTPQILRVRKNQLFEFECFGQTEDGTPYGKPHVEFTDGSLVSNDTRFVLTHMGLSRIRVTAPDGINISDVLQIKCLVNKKISVITINIENTCPPYHRLCKNKQCLPNGKFCDGVRDCDDGSDEDEYVCNVCEPATAICLDVNGVKPSKPTVNRNWLCDGENDCGNNYDEIHCQENDKKCNGMSFICGDNTTIPRGYVCDGTSDCSSGDDETNCLSPVILKTCETRIRGKIGSQVKLQCEAAAYPLPTIIWRFNWGCLPNESRFVVNSINKNCRKVISTLTINNFQPGDDAIYNCEALSSTNRMLSSDFQVSIQ